jgi:hypothetical protein
MENTLKRILKFKGVAIPASSSSHKDLLTLSVQENFISEVYLTNSIHIAVSGIFSFMVMV